MDWWTDLSYAALMFYGFVARMNNQLSKQNISRLNIPSYGIDVPDSKVHGAKVGQIWGR